LTGDSEFPLSGGGRHSASYRDGEVGDRPITTTAAADDADAADATTNSSSSSTAAVSDSDSSVTQSTQLNMARGLVKIEKWCRVVRNLPSST
jgi:hypothetical protein